MVQRAARRWCGLARRRLPAVALACLTAGFAFAAGDDGDPTRADRLRERILAEERDRTTRLVGLLRLRASWPQGVSAAVGLMRVHQPSSYDCRTPCPQRGPFVQLEPGLVGLQVGAGWGRLIAERGGNERFLSEVYVGYGIKGVLLRTWDDRTVSPAGQTFAGVEGEFSITTVNFSLGILRGISPGDGDERWVVTGGLGWGF